uniref:Uncharacterized protein n=1 Tax=Arundo donax TaxID=35708 RepID=A0A0A8ZJ73_ARUDO
MPSALHFAGCLDTAKFGDVWLDLSLRIQFPEIQQVHLFVVLHLAFDLDQFDVPMQSRELEPKFAP